MDSSSNNITEKSINQNNKSTLNVTNLTFDSSRLPLDSTSNKSQTKDTKRIKKQFNIITSYITREKFMKQLYQNIFLTIITLIYTSLISMSFLINTLTMTEGIIDIIYFAVEAVHMIILLRVVLIYKYKCQCDSNTPKTLSSSECLNLVGLKDATIQIDIFLYSIHSMLTVKIVIIAIDVILYFINVYAKTVMSLYELITVGLIMIQYFYYQKLKYNFLSLLRVQAYLYINNKNNIFIEKMN